MASPGCNTGPASFMSFPITRSPQNWKPTAASMPPAWIFAPLAANAFRSSPAMCFSSTATPLAIRATSTWPTSTGAVPRFTTTVFCSSRLWMSRRDSSG